MLYFRVSQVQLGAFSRLPADATPRRICFGNPPFGDAPFQDAVDMEGAIVVLRRGICSFAAKALRAQDAGAAAVVILQTVDVWPFTMQVRESLIEFIDDLFCFYLPFYSSRTKRAFRQRCGYLW